MAESAEDVLNQETRRVIYDYVRALPGVHLRRVARELGLPIGQVMYHLDYLQRRELVVSKKDEGFKRYFVRNLFTGPEKTLLAALRHAVPRRVTQHLLVVQEATHREILDHVDVSASTLSFHLARMVSAGVLAREKVGRTQRYTLADPVTAARMLHRFRETFGEPTRRVVPDGADASDSAPARAEAAAAWRARGA